MKKIILFGILLIFLALPFTYAQETNEISLEKGGKIINKVIELIKINPITNSRDNNKCDISKKTCRVTLTNLYRPFYMNKETYYIKKIYNKDIMEIYNKEKELLWTGDIKEKEFIQLFGIEYKKQDMRYSADRLYLKKIQSTIYENGFEGNIE